MEYLARLVCAVDDEFEPGVPRGIDAGREDVVVGHTDLLDGSIVGDDRSTVMLTGVELHAVGVVLLIVVAVDALSLGAFRAEHIVIDDGFIVVFQTALVDGQFLIGDIRGGNEAVADVGIDAVGRHIDVEGLEARPRVVLLRVDLYLDGIALGCFGQLSPLVGIGLYLGASTNDLLFASRQTGYYIIGVAVDLER